MDARFLKAVVLTAALASLGANQRTANFIVTAPTAEQAKQIATAAEKYRRELAMDWLGREMPAWAEPCPIVAQVADNLGAGGATSFLFEHGEVYGWRMSIQGSQERILDSVLPHEVTHTIFASHFRRPLPRWADEGACTTVEHASERTKQQVMLVDFLRTGRGIAFSRMFAMKEYPHDVMPLYSQGYSVARYLIAQGGRRKFLEYLADGMRDENWIRATKAHYGYTNLAVLQDTWLGWVRSGSPAIGSPKPGPAAPAAPQLAASDRRNRPEPNLILRAQSADPAEPLAYLSEPTGTAGRPANGAGAAWRAPRPGAPASDDGVGVEVAATTTQELATTSVAGSEASTPHQVTRPQATERPRQIILEWSRASRSAEAPSAPAATPEPAMPPAVSAALEETASIYAQTVRR